jgi:hypothetical protein
MINIKGMNKAEVLKALYDHSHVQGMGFMQAVPDGYVTVEHCQMLLDSTGYPYFDYLYGRVLKVDLSGDEFDERLYDRDCGPGAAARALRPMTKQDIVSTMAINLGAGDIKAKVVYEFNELYLTFRSVRDIDKMIHMLEQHRHRVVGGNTNDR